MKLEIVVLERKTIVVEVKDQDVAKYLEGKEIESIRIKPRRKIAPPHWLDPEEAPRED